ncbi:hypothetical protein M8C21_018254, partial [Ambrosia artemisiifolia]
LHDNQLDPTSVATGKFSLNSNALKENQNGLENAKNEGDFMRSQVEADQVEEDEDIEDIINANDDMNMDDSSEDLENEDDVHRLEIEQIQRPELEKAIARESRMSQKNMHTAGPKSFARICEEMKNADPNQQSPTLTQLFERTRKRTEGRVYVDTYDNTQTKIVSSFYFYLYVNIHVLCSPYVNIHLSCLLITYRINLILMKPPVTHENRH